MAEDDLAELVATAEAFEGSRVVGAVEHLHLGGLGKCRSRRREKDISKQKTAFHGMSFKEGGRAHRGLVEVRRGLHAAPGRGRPRIARLIR